MKLGIIVDSASGITKAEADKKKWGYLPLYMKIDNKEYADGVDITPSQYYKMINLDMDVKTSATPPGKIMEELEKYSKKFDEVIVYTISTKLSSQYNNVATIAKEFKNVHVLESKGVGEAIKIQAETLESMAKDHSIKEIVYKGNKLTKTILGIAIPETLDWLAKGGRASGATAAMGNLLKIIPMILFQDGELKKHGKGRVFRKTILKAVDSILQITNNKKVDWVFMSAGNNDSKEYAKEVEEHINQKIIFSDFPPIIGNHIGKGAVAIMVFEK